VTRRDRHAGVPAATSGVTVTFPIHLRNGSKGRKRLRQGERPTVPQVEKGRIPRVSRLMALALHIEGLIQKGVVKDYADLARLGGVSRARISQVMELLNLAPDLQGKLLLLPRTVSGRDHLSERQLRRITAEAKWEAQRRLWKAEGHHREPSTVVTTSSGI